MIHLSMRDQVVIKVVYGTWIKLHCLLPPKWSLGDICNVLCQLHARQTDDDEQLSADVRTISI